MKKICSSLLFLLFTKIIFSADTIYIDSSSVMIDLFPGTNMEYLIDTEGKLAFEDAVKQNFSSETSEEAIIKANAAAVIWTKLTIKNTLRSAAEYYLWWNPSGGVYILNEDTSFTVKKTGRFLPFRFRDVKVTEPLVQIFLAAGKTKTVYAKIIQGESWINNFVGMEASLYEGKGYLQEMTDKNWEFGIYFGILFFIAIYNLIFFFTLRDKSYLYYVLAILSLATIWVNNNNYTFRYLFPESDNARAYTGTVGTYCIFLTALFYIVFTSHYLRTKEILPRWHKIIKGMIRLVIAAIALEIISDLIWGRGFPFSVDRFVAMAYLFISVVVAFFAYRKKYQPAKLFLWGNGILFLGIFLTVYRQIVPFQHVFGHISFFQAGTIAQVLFFSLGLAKRINVIRDEHEQAQEKIIHQLKENEELKDKVNRELEQKVQERTAELSEQKKIVEEKNKEILDSIRYAKRIQNALLTPVKYIERTLTRLKK